MLNLERPGDMTAWIDLLFVERWRTPERAIQAGIPMSLGRDMITGCQSVSRWVGSPTKSYGDQYDLQ